MTGSVTGGIDAPLPDPNLGASSRPLPFAIVLMVAAGGVIYAVLQPAHWLRGVLIVAAAMALGGTFRAVLTDEQAGLLAVRSKWFDVTFFAAAVAAIVICALYLPN